MRPRLRIVGLATVVGLGVAGSAWAQNATTASAEDENAIRKDVEAYSEAYGKGDIEAVGQHWTPDAEYINDEGKITKGRDAIVALFKKGRVARKGYGFKATLQNVRFIKPDVALADGTTTLAAPDGSSESTRFVAVAVKAAGAWRLSRVQDLASSNENEEISPRTRLKQLEWLVGQWEDEGKDAHIQMTCHWAPGNSFLIQEYKIHRPGGEILEISQRVGWDPSNDRLRSWIFDSRGGFSEGVWERKGNQWNVAVMGVLPDGHRASARQAWTFVDNDHFKWQALDRQVDSRPLTDTIVTFRREIPAQAAATEPATRESK
ncbi:MAG TPA: SgcJ/EcaC family oxidoreductase [Planctomycetaceae bacterium]|nr:SgcJ/EcaC family oxidoreductase [Planctomycetaceae bacterium]